MSVNSKTISNSFYPVRCLALYTFLLLTTAAHASTNPAKPAETYSLKQAVEYATRTAPDVQTAKLNLEIADLSLKNQWRAFLPTLDFTGSLGIAQTSPRSNTNPYASSWSLAANHKIFDKGSKIVAVNKAKRELDLAEIQLHESREKLSLNITKAFYQLSENAYLLKTKQTEAKLLRKQFNLVEQQYRQGLKTRIDYLRLKADVQKSNIEVLGIKNSRKQTIAELRRLLGVPLNSQASINFMTEAVEPIDLKKVDTDLIAVKDHRQHRIASLNTRIARYAVSTAKQDFWPGLNLATAFTRSESGFLAASRYGTDSPETDQWSATLTLNFNILDWGIRRNNIKSAVRQSASTELTQRNSLYSLRKELTDLQTAFELELENYKLNKELLALEETSYSVLERDYRNGRTSYLNFIDGVRKLSSARNQFYSSHFRLKGLIADRYYHQGKLHEVLVQ